MAAWISLSIVGATFVITNLVALFVGLLRMHSRFDKLEGGQDLINQHLKMQDDAIAAHRTERVESATALQAHAVSDAQEFSKIHSRLDSMDDKLEVIRRSVGTRYGEEAKS